MLSLCGRLVTPSRVRRPVVGSMPDEIVDWILQIVVRVDIVAMETSKLALHQLYGQASTTMRTQVVAK